MREPPTRTFAEAWSSWLAYRRHCTRPLRDSTLADYESAYRVYLGPLLADLPLAALDGATIADVTIALGRAPISAKRASNVLVPLRACLRWHHRMGSLPADPSPWFDTSVPAAEERRILTPAQIEALVAATPAHYRAFVATAAYTGMRLGELRALTWGDVDLEARLARVTKSYYRARLQPSTKTGLDRVVPLPPALAAELAAWRAHARRLTQDADPQRGPGRRPGHTPAIAPDLVFPAPRGTPIDADDFRARVFKPAAARAGLPPGTRFHDLRHTCASLYLESGATLREVMAIFGWTQLQTALRYLHTTGPLTETADRLEGLMRADATAARRPR